MTRPPSGADIVVKTCQVLEVQVVDVLGHSRHPRVVLVRMIIARLCRDITTLSLNDIAHALGRPGGHSTVSTALRRMARALSRPDGPAVELAQARAALELDS